MGENKEIHNKFRLECLKGLNINGKNKLECLRISYSMQHLDYIVFNPINRTNITVIIIIIILQFGLSYIFRPLQGHHQEVIYEGIKSTANFKMCNMYRVKTQYCQYFQLKLLQLSKIKVED